MRSALFSVMWTSSRQRQERHTSEHRHRDAAHQRERGGSILRLRLAERRNAVADRLDAGQRCATGSERAEPEEDDAESAELVQLRFDLVRARCGHQLRPCQQPEHAYHDHADDAEDEGVRRDGEGHAALAQASQVEQHDDRDDPECRLHRISAERLQQRRGGEVRHACRHRDRHREHVVDEQCRSDDDAEVAPEVDRSDLVVATTRGIRVHVLPVGRDDCDHDDDHGQAGPRRQREVRQAAQGEHDEDLLGGVRDRRHGIAGEHRKRDALGQQLLGQRVAAHGSPEQDPLRQIRQHRHAANRRRAIGRALPSTGTCL